VKPIAVLPILQGIQTVYFYNGRLRVATDLSRLKAPPGVSHGIHWTEIVGEVKSGGGSGCFCQAEVDAVSHTS
jgi:hypothetical protein